MCCAQTSDKRPPPYAELHCQTNFSFLRGASHPEELVDRAAELGYRALAVTDRNSLAGVVRMHLAARERGLKLVIGAEIVPIDAPPVVLLAPTREAYGRLSRLITVGRRRAVKGDCRITFEDIAGHSEGLLALCYGRHRGTEAQGHEGGRRHGATEPRSDEGKGCATATLVVRPRPSSLRGLSPLPHGRGSDTASLCPYVPTSLLHYRGVFGDRAYLLLEPGYGGDDAAEVDRLRQLSQATGLPLVAGNDVHYHVSERRYLHDVLTCIRHRCAIHEAGERLRPNARRHLLEPEDLVRRLASCPEAIERTVALAGQCAFSLDELRYEYPRELCPEGISPMDHLSRLTWAGARERYAGRVPEHVRRMLEHELALIRELRYEPYFLTVWDLVRFARDRGILCQGRGSAANSAVCYCLGVTAVDPAKIDLLFERFVSRERNEPPDIDVDFEHERREEVFQYIYDKYGRERAAITAEVITYRPRSAIRDVGKALGLSLDAVDALAKRLDWWDHTPIPEEIVREAGFDPNDRTLRMLGRLVRELVGFPRHLSQHVGGFVITEGPLCETVPIENAAMPDRTFIQWDKNDLDAMGMLKVDCLALGMLTCIRKCFDILREPRSDEGTKARRREESDGVFVPSSLLNIPPEDPAVYDMICAADTVGVFQIESRAQMAMLPRLRPRNFYDLVIEVAIVRPGPIQGGMVHPYLRRRNGEEPVTYSDPAIEEVLRKTLGVPLFQEQAMRLAVVAAGFTPGEADELRRAMGAWRRNGKIDQFRTRLIEGMTANGHPEEFAERCFKQISGFGEYGFPESHAASFALLVYASAWLKRYHPATFAAALINSQPMGFYAPAQIVRDAQQHGVRVLPPDVNRSGYDCTLEEEATERRSHEATKGEGGTKDEGTEGQRDGGTKEGSSQSSVFSSRSSTRSESRSALADPWSRGPWQKGTGSEHTKTCDVGNATQRGACPLLPQWGTDGPALRLGLRLVRGLSAEKVRGIEAAQARQPITSIRALARRDDVSRDTLARLAAADAFRSLGLNRREALWEVLGLGEDEPGLFDDLEPDEPKPVLPRTRLSEQVVRDYETIGLSLTAHPIALVRRELTALGVKPNAALKQAPRGRRISVSGLVLVRQRPSTSKGVVFMTLEDETAIANLIIRPNVWQRYRRAARNSVAVVADGVVERKGEVVHVLPTRITDASERLADLKGRSRDFH